MVPPTPYHLHKAKRVNQRGSRGDEKLRTKDRLRLSTGISMYLASDVKGVLTECICSSARLQKCSAPCPRTYATRNFSAAILGKYQPVLVRTCHSTLDQASIDHEVAGQVSQNENCTLTLREALLR
jgi:hypothetical protein